jgi:glycosyltransferase involved in cell wall biosynthesis
MRLVVLFSRGMSLHGWRAAGLLDRELALYRAMRPYLEHLAFVTYGDAGEAALAAQVPGVDVLSNRWRLPSNVYSILAPVLHRRVLRQATVFRTNQLNGAWTGVIAKRLFNKKLVVRCGFVWSDFVTRLHPGNWRHAVALRLERLAVRAADAVILATESDRDTIVERHGIRRERTHLIPNFVDTEAFRPLPGVTREPGRTTFVGRLDDQKNLPALIEAVETLPGVRLVIIGDGPRRHLLESWARQRRVNVSFLGVRQHAELPALLNRSAVFVLPSHYEGHPKALLEAMACGVPVIGTRVTGIQELLRHRETGYLCGTSAAELREALREVLGDAALSGRMSAGARDDVCEFNSLKSAVERELAVLRALEAR